MTTPETWKSEDGALELRLGDSLELATSQLSLY